MKLTRKHFIVSSLVLLLLTCGILYQFTDLFNPPDLEVVYDQSDHQPLLFNQERWVGGVNMDVTDPTEWVNTLQSTGMNTVEVTAYAMQGIWNSDDLQFSDPSPETLKEIRIAKERGMKVVLILRTKLNMELPENDFLWHGLIFPETEKDVNSWFAKYQEFTSVWTEVAEKEGVDMVVLGSELNSLFTTVNTNEFPRLEAYYLNTQKQKNRHYKLFDRSRHVPPEEFEKMAMPKYGNFEACLVAESVKNALWANVTTFSKEEEPVKMINKRRALLAQHWKDLIQHNRSLYSGKLSLATNFDNYKQLAFWSYLDCISINAYFPLRTLDAPTEAQMVESWRKVFDGIDQFRAASEIMDRPVFFTELGYTEWAGSTLCPWQGHGFSYVQEPARDSIIFWSTQPKELNERNMAVSALLKAVKQSNFPLQGLLYWKFATQDFDLSVHPFAVRLEPNDQSHIPNTLAKICRLP